MISLCSLTFCNTTKIKQQKKRFLWVHRIQLFFVSIYYVWINRKAKGLRIQFQVSLASNYLKRFTATRCLIEKGTQSTISPTKWFAACRMIGVIENFSSPPNIYLFTVNNIRCRKKCEISPKISIKTPERCQWHCPSLFVVNFEHVTLSFVYIE